MTIEEMLILIHGYRGDGPASPAYLIQGGPNYMMPQHLMEDLGEELPGWLWDIGRIHWDLGRSYTLGESLSV